MKEDFFLYKSHCELGIVSDEVTPELISETLNIVPTRYFKKGEQSISKHSRSIITKPHNLWAIRSLTTDLKEETISHHIEYMKSILLPRLEALEMFKTDKRCEVIFYIWIETDNAGLGLDLSDSEMAFIYTVSNRVHFSFVTNN